MWNLCEVGHPAKAIQWAIGNEKYRDVSLDHLQLKALRQLPKGGEKKKPRLPAILLKVSAPRKEMVGARRTGTSFGKPTPVTFSQLLFFGTRDGKVFVTFVTQESKKRLLFFSGFLYPGKTVVLLEPSFVRKNLTLDLPIVDIEEPIVPISMELTDFGEIAFPVNALSTVGKEIIGSHDTPKPAL